MASLPLFTPSKALVLRQQQLLLSMLPTDFLGPLSTLLVMLLEVTTISFG